MVKNQPQTAIAPPQGARTKIYSLLRNFLQTSYTIIFAHMPKAAGISLNTIMKKQYGNNRVLEIDPNKPRKAYLGVVTMPIWSALSLRAISGHVVWGLHNWTPKPFIYITVLRDPVERVLSFYSYVLASPTHFLHKEMMDKKTDLEEFLNWDKSIFEVSNLQSKLLASMSPFHETQHMSTTFAMAKFNLEQYFLVGLTEQFGRSLNMFANSFSWSNVQITHENITPNRICRTDISHHVIQQIETLNKYDMELYEIGRRLFTEQLRDPHAAFIQKLGR